MNIYLEGKAKKTHGDNTKLARELVAQGGGEFTTTEIELIRPQLHLAAKDANFKCTTRKVKRDTYLLELWPVK